MEGIVFVGLYLYGIVVMTLFAGTWIPLAIRARLHRARNVSIVRIIDYVGFFIILLLAFILIMRTQLVYGVRTPQDEWAALGRVLLPAGVDLLATIRLAKWVHQLRTQRRGGREADPFDSR